MPEFGQHAYRIEASAQECKRRNDQRWYNTELFPVVRPDAEDKAKQTECDRRKQQKRDHPERMHYDDIDKEVRRGQDNEPDDDGFRRRRANIADRRFEG